MVKLMIVLEIDLFNVFWVAESKFVTTHQNFSRQDLPPPHNFF